MKGRKFSRIRRRAIRQTERFLTRYRAARTAAIHAALTQIAGRAPE